MDTKNLTAAFRELVKSGFIARRNFSCCTNCAGNDIANEAAELIDKGKDPSEIRGTVFYHRQSGERLRKTGECHLYFGRIHTAKHGNLGAPSKVVGREAVAILRKHGVDVTWNGKADSALLVRAS